MGFEVLEQVWQVSRGVLVHLAKVLFTWHCPFVHLPNLIKKIIERVFTLGNWCFGLLCTTCQHTIWTWIACNHWQHHKPFIDVNPNPNHKPVPAIPPSHARVWSMVHTSPTFRQWRPDAKIIWCKLFRIFKKTHTVFAIDKLLWEEKFAHIWAELKGWITILQPEQRNIKKDEGSVGSVSVYLTDRHKK